MRILKWALFGLLFSLLTPIFVFYFSVKSSGIERLTSEYPYFDHKQSVFKLSPRRPESWVELHRVSRVARWAIVVSEDWSFFNHPGIDLEQLKIVLRESWEKKEFTRGASTITQQVVKNVFLSDERTLWRKGREMLLALYLERILSKEEILEIYLNIAHLGRDLYGIGNAGLYYFQVQPWDLSAKQGAFLSMLLPSPERYSVSYRRMELSPFAQEQIAAILIKLRQAKILSEEERLQAQSEVFSWELGHLNMP